MQEFFARFVDTPAGCRGIFNLSTFPELFKLFYGLFFTHEFQKVKELAIADSSVTSFDQTVELKRWVIAT